MKALRRSYESKVVDVGASVRQAELDRQKAEFFAKGNSVTVLPSYLASRPSYDFNRGPVVDRHSGHVVSRPSRELVNGRQVVRMAAMQMQSGLSATQLRRLQLGDPNFPAPVPKVKPQAWDAEAFTAWVESRNGG